MTSPDTIILLIVDYHATIGGKTTVPLAYAPFAASPKCLHFLSATMSAEVRIEVMLTYISAVSQSFSVMYSSQMEFSNDR